MATSYPGAIDAFSNPGPTTPENQAGLEHDVLHANANDAIEAIESELGTNPSGAYATVAERLSATAVTPTIDLPLSTLAGWTVQDGTWAIVDGFLQSTTGAAQGEILLDQRVGMSMLVAQFETRVLSGSSTHRASIGINEPANASTNYPVVHVIMSTNAGSTWHSSADAADVTARGIGPAISGLTGYSTWVTARVVFVGDTASVWINGVCTGTFTQLNNTASSQENRWLNLSGLNGVQQFRNLKIWDAGTIINAIIGA